MWELNIKDMNKLKAQKKAKEIKIFMKIKLP